MWAGPTISVIIPTFNRAVFIRRAIDSVLAQTYRDLEIIVIDDGSTDETAVGVQEMVQKDKRVRYVRHDRNRGAQAARNTGIRVAQGSYVALLDSDDEWAPDKLERQMQLFYSEDSRLGIVYTGYQEMGAAGSSRRCHVPSARGDLRKRLLSQYGLGPSSIMLMRKDCLMRAGMCDEGIQACQEWELCIRLSRYATFDYVPEPLTIYHFHNLPTISKDLMRDAEGYLQVITRHREEIVEECGRAAMGAHYRQAGQKFIKAGRFDLAGKMYRLSLMHAPLNPRSILHVAASALGEGGYAISRTTWRKLHLC